MKTIKDIDLKDKRTLLRCDFNVPLSEKGDILDDFKIKKTIPTIEYLIGKRAKIILMSHLGRPKGEVVERLRLTSIQARLGEYLKIPIAKTADCVGLNVKKQIQEMQPGGILLLENIQFHPGEIKNDLKFAKTLAGYGDIFIMEAFGQAHRNYASITGITEFLPSFAGFLLEKEIDSLSRVIENPERPLVAIIGGAKIESKTMVIKTFLEKADHLLLGGKIANSVLAVKGIWPFGDLPSEEVIKEIEKMPLTLTKLHLPVDVLASSDSSGKDYLRQSALAGIKKDELLLDIGEETRNIFSKIIKEAKTIVWSGPLGFFENPLFEKGTKEIAESIIKNEKAFKVAGGGETAEFINKNNLKENFDHVSTGGGAMLEFLSGKKLPGIEVLRSEN